MAVADGLIYLAANALIASYALASHRARAAHAQNMIARQELQAANRRLQDYSSQMEQLVVVRERARMGRELHDSVTQTIFSMNLTAQSALLLLQNRPGPTFDRVEEQLARMEKLAQGAMAEMQLLISELNPQRLTADGLEDAIRRHLAERRLPETLSASFDAQGSIALEPAEEQALFRIVQEFTQ